MADPPVREDRSGSFELRKGMFGKHCIYTGTAPFLNLHAGSYRLKVLSVLTVVITDDIEL